jgi:uncharacterized protein (TIGR02145 family)
VPTDDEWKTLIFSVGDASNAGGRMKSAGTLEMGTGLWHDPNTGASNESGFTALPGGYRSQSGGFDLYSYNAFFWSSSEKDLFSAWDREMTYKYESIDRMDKSKSNGFSVRCIRDEKK